MISLYRRASSEHINNIKQFLERDKLRFNTFLNISIKHDIQLDGFDKIDVIGEEVFGRVYLVLNKRTKCYHSLKQLKKKTVVDMNKVDHCWNEKRILQSTNFPFIVHLNYYFFDNSYIYFVVPFLAGGNLFKLLSAKGKFDEHLTKFYVAQIVLALEYLHYMEVVHRDLRLENVMIDAKGYIKITDLQYCKQIKDRTYSLCGSPENIAPEMILNKGYGFSVDWWSLGVITYEMSSGSPPFQHWDHMILYETILKGGYKVLPEFSENLKDLLNGLIEIDLTKRYGNLKNGVNDVKKHKWFSHIGWPALLNREIEAPFIPVVKSPGDVSNFATLSDETTVIADTNEFSDKFNHF